MPRVGSESAISVFEQATIFHALDRAATVIAKSNLKTQTPLIPEVPSPNVISRNPHITYVN
jgi:hypothetical protein